MCCNKKPQIINKLNKPSYVQLAVDVWERVSPLAFEDITDDLWDEMFHIYSIIFPKSNGLPSKEELVKIIENAAQYKVRITKK